MSVTVEALSVESETTRKEEGEALYKRLAAPLKTPILIDLRRRCAEDAKRNGASEKVIAGILAVSLEVGP